MVSQEYCGDGHESPIFTVLATLKLHVENTSAQPVILARSLPDIVTGRVARPLESTDRGEVEFEFGGSEMYSDVRRQVFGATPNADRFVILAPSASFEGRASREATGCTARTEHADRRLNAPHPSRCPAVAVSVDDAEGSRGSVSQMEPCRQTAHRIGSLELRADLDSGRRTPEGLRSRAITNAIGSSRFRRYRCAR